MSSELNGRGSGAAGRALGARARARSLRGDACLCALATVQLEVHVLNLRDRRLVDLLVDADGRHSVARKSGSMLAFQVERAVSRARADDLDSGRRR